jgi:hypothetical protein
MRRLSGIFAFLLVLFSAPLARADGTLIKANGAADILYDDAHDLLYITSGKQVLRYQVGTATFLAPITIGADLMGMDLSLDGTTLAVADNTYDSKSNTDWVHLINLATLTDTKVSFALTFMEGGTISAVYGSDGALFVSSKFLGTGGQVPIRRIDPASSAVTTVDTAEVAGVLTHSGTRGAIAYFGTEGETVGDYTVKNRRITHGQGSGSGVSGLGVNQIGSLYAVSGKEGTYFLDKTLQRNGDLIGKLFNGPVSSAFHPDKPLVYFPWAGTQEVRVYNTRTRTQVGTFNFQDGFTFPGTVRPYAPGTRAILSKDGRLLFVTVSAGVRYVSTKRH